MGTDLYPHMLIVLVWYIATVCVARALADSSDLGILGEQSSEKNGRFPACLGRRWTAVQNLTPLALPSAKKSVTVQTQKNKQTVNDICTPCLSAHVYGVELLNVVCCALKVSLQYNQLSAIPTFYCLLFCCALALRRVDSRMTNSALFMATCVLSFSAVL